MNVNAFVHVSVIAICCAVNMQLMFCHCFMKIESLTCALQLWITCVLIGIFDAIKPMEKLGLVLCNRQQIKRWNEWWGHKMLVLMYSRLFRSSYEVNTEYHHEVNLLYRLCEISMATSLDVAMVTAEEWEWNIFFYIKSFINNNFS